ncbi:putative inactive ATP-dependent zinc metalloprotease FTSHI 5, chloroplastic [Vitis vinifera]|uniref:Putative inactive ATP-dependent zinc metalloprotease FTSHI 5, chloroplastic n=1 Tax=Vitis vinifera TaxID=29760 RepID=A0A438IGW7_VITVI|nr:putative inactive ATP-dependent zinc metalloprotease FTSHI 5, chloroplastic [Vitis vinifera]
MVEMQMHTMSCCVNIDALSEVGRVQQDLERIVEENGGIREKEPFFLSKVHEKEPESSSFLDSGNGSGTALLGAAT